MQPFMESFVPFSDAGVKPCERSAAISAGSDVINGAIAAECGGVGSIYHAENADAFSARHAGFAQAG
eukprot:3052459-Rhodomonas_salina.1